MLDEMNWSCCLNRNHCLTIEKKGSGGGGGGGGGGDDAGDGGSGGGAWRCRSWWYCWC